MAETLSAAGTLGAAQETVKLALPGMGGVSVQVTNTFSGTITFEGSVDGVNFAALSVSPATSGTAVTTTTGTGLWSASAVGLLAFRARMSSYTSGSATVVVQSGVAAPGGSGGSGGGGGAVTIADGADVTEGAIADAAVTGDNSGTESAKLRGLNKIFADVWDSVSHYLKVNIQNTSLAVTTPLAGPFAGQAKIAITGTAVQLGSNALSNGVILTAKSTNTAIIVVGGASVANTVDGTGNGYLLAAGASVSFAVSNSNALYINGTAGDIVSFAGS